MSDLAEDLASLLTRHMPISCLLSPPPLFRSRLVPRLYVFMFLLSLLSCPRWCALKSRYPLSPF